MKYNPTYYKNIIYLSLLIFCSSYCKAQTMSSAGNSWTVTIPSITEAGSNYGGIYESAGNQIILAVRVPLLLGSTKVSVHYEANPTWHNSLILSGRRTNDGATLCLLCSISGGTTYQTITQSDIELFRIRAVLEVAFYREINIQLQLRGVSVTTPAAAYNSLIVFTVSPT